MPPLPLSVSPDPIIQLCRHTSKARTSYLSPANVHTRTHTAQVSIMKEGVWTAASPVWTMGHACHSPYVTHIPEIKPCRKISHILTQMGERQMLLLWIKHTHKYRHAKVELIKKERKCVCLCVCLYFFMWPRGRPFSMLSFQLLLDELFWSSGPLHSQPGLSEVCPTTHKHTPTD